MKNAAAIMMRSVGIAPSNRRTMYRNMLEPPNPLGHAQRTRRAARLPTVAPDVPSTQPVVVKLHESIINVNALFPAVTKIWKQDQCLASQQATQSTPV